MNNSATPSTQEREAALFALAIEKPVAERAAFLQAVCGSDNAMHERLRALMSAHEQPHDALGAGPPEAPTVKFKLDVAGGVKDMDHREDELACETVERTIGRYRLLEKLGEGGCGVVYVAEQTDPVRRRIALKVIKLGMDTRAVVARFEAERQALAMMDHPNIAKVLDAGATEAGRPYFVMELVRGIRITDYCDQNNLNTRERLDLFIKVCQAIQHAHQKGIIHRDIKPSNILVTLHDGVPVPKVIDFGIAKATEGRLTDATVYTHLHQFIGTPAYMSPEQAEMSGLDIDTRSDIYSLGVLLYELLTGKTPFESRELIEAGIDAMRRMIREKEPARPSTRLSTMAGGDLTSTAKCRSVNGVKLIHLVRGDLDWIVMKSLEKDRTRRYETANGFAVDIQRHLNNEPVVARPPSTLYRLQKSVRRNRLVYGAAAAVALALIVGAIASYRQTTRALAAESLANTRLTEVAAERDGKEQARLEAEQVSKFLQEVFQSADPGRDGRTVTVAETLDRAVRQLDTELANQPERRARFQTTLAGTYSALGLNTSAIPLFENARSFWAGRFGTKDPKTVQASIDLVEMYVKAGRFEDALPLGEETRALSEKVNGPEHSNTLWAMHHLANVYYSTGRGEEALKLREQVLALRRKSPAVDPVGLHMAMNNLGNSYMAAGRLDEAVRLNEEGRDLARKVYGKNHLRNIQAHFNVGVAYYHSGRNAEALKIFEETVPWAQKSLGPEHPILVLPLHYLGLARLAAGLKEDALKAQREADQLVRKVYGTEHPEAGRVFHALGECLAALGRFDERAKLWSDLFTSRERRKGLEHHSTLAALQEFAGSYAIQGKLPEARKLLLKVDGINHWPDAAHYALLYLGVIEASLGERSSYESHRRRILTRFASTTALTIAERMAKTALLLPLEGEDLRTALDLAERAFTAGETNMYAQYFFFTGALAKYRAGQWPTAAERAERALALASEGPSYLQALDYLVLAMARNKMSQPVESRAALAKADEIIQRDFPSPQNLRIANWHDILATHLLLREAKALIESSAAVPSL